MGDCHHWSSYGTSCNASRTPRLAGCEGLLPLSTLLWGCLKALPAHWTACLVSLFCSVYCWKACPLSRWKGCLLSRCCSVSSPRRI